MEMETAFENQHAAVGNTELWRILKKKTTEENLPTSFLDAVGKICSHGIILSKDIIRFFPTFTLHDETHIVNVCCWMTRLLGGRKMELSACEAALLSMSACCHDIGMSVSVEQEGTLIANPKSQAWSEYFRNHLNDDEEFNRTNTISINMLRNFIRTNHHKRISEQINASSWPQELLKQGITRQVLIDLCQSHGEPLDSLRVPKRDNYDLRLCAVLLRLSDILDFDSSRAPLNLFKHLGLEHPENIEQSVSQTEWAKNRSGVFGEVSNDIIPFTASFTSLQLECEVQAYLDWVQQELDASSEYLSNYLGNWQTLILPRKISTDSIERIGYRSGKFCLTMDQNRVLELLVGRNLYSDPGVFVRELLQNSIDAVHTRSILDPHFQKKEGKLTICTWMDNEGYSWFRVEDNGTGMDEHIITNYFLKVGCSYYTSHEFKADKRHYGRGSDYTPISRFGIGILSCFMSDPVNNLLEVSTKRYSQDPIMPNPAIRLNITGLNGYYYLAQEGDQDEYDDSFMHMHHPQNQCEGYRSEVGTTICVRVNMFQVSNNYSLKEIVDKYVRFPEITIEYLGPEGHFIYPTQDELMDTVHRLNPDGPDSPLKEYIHTVSEEQFKQIKAQMPDTKWAEKPSIMLQYCPLDWFSDSENITGVAIFADIRTRASTSPFEYEGQEIHPKFNRVLRNTPDEREIEYIFSYSFPKTAKKGMRSLKAQIMGSRKFRNKFERVVWREFPNHRHDSVWLEKLASKYKVSKNQIDAKYYELAQARTCDEKNRDILDLFLRLNDSHRFTISYQDLCSQLNADESNVIRYTIDACYFSESPFLQNKINPTLTVYNGILTDNSDQLGKGSQCIGYVLLLRKSYCPEMDLARGSISRLPLETVCELSLAQHALYKRKPCFALIHKDFFNNQFAFVSECDLQHILSTHPVWQKQLLLNNVPIPEWNQQIQPGLQVRIPRIEKDSAYDYLRLAAIKERYAVYFDTSSPKTLFITLEPTDESTSSFPVTMFYKAQRNNAPLGNINLRGINYYNADHEFSKWLIANRKSLQEQVPSIYDNLLEVMILCCDPSKIIETVNKLLGLLKSYHNNSFGVTDSLLLRDEDLK